MTDKNVSNISEDGGRGYPVVIEKQEVLSRKLFLKDKTIGISISESDNLSELGYGVTHLKDAVIEIARYILAAGGKLSYGGDMRQGGFTELLFELLLFYQADKSLLPHERFFSYLAYPISTTFTPEKEASLRQNVSFKKIAPPMDISVLDQTQFLKPDSTENLYVWTRCLTEMREKMEASCNARIFIGGRSKGFKGKCPGILEEVLIAIHNKHPIYLLGAFGGVTQDIVEALNGKSPNTFTNEYYDDNEAYKALISFYNQKHPSDKIDYKEFSSRLSSISLKEIALVNGLSEEENMRLTVTPHISEAIYLILKGLANQQSK